MVVNEYFDEIISSLNAIEIQALDSRVDKIVWDLTTKIYISSGYQVELIWVRDIVCSRIEGIKQKQAFEEQRRVEQERIAAEQKRIADKAHLLAAQQKARRDAELKKQIEEARRLEAEEEARLTAEKERIAKEALRIEQQRKEAEIEQTVLEFKQQYRDEIASLLKLCDGDEGKAMIFLLIRPFIAEQCSINENKVKIDSNLFDYPNIDELDFFELQMTLEEEFDIEMGDEECQAIGFPEFKVSYDYLSSSRSLLTHKYSMSNQSDSGSLHGFFSNSTRLVSQDQTTKKSKADIEECLIIDLVELLFKKAPIKNFIA